MISTIAQPIAGLRFARRALALLTLINLLNYLDRFVVSALVESLKRSELALSDAKLGALMTAFLLVYMIASPIFGLLADGGAARPKLLAVGVGLWSIATLLSALATSYPALFAARALVGVGEAAYGTVAPAMIADQFAPERRSRAFAIFFSAIPIGSALGYILGGLVDHLWSWRAAFLVAGTPGLGLALAALRLPDPPRLGEKSAPALERRAFGAYPRLLRNAPYVATVLGYAAYTFAVGGMAFWMPAFLERVRHVPRASATIQFGAVVVVTGFVGTFAGGWIADALRRRFRRADLSLCGIATLLAAPLAVAVFVAPSRGLWFPALVVGQLLLFASTGPVNTVAMEVVSPAERATAQGLLILTIHALGDVPSPWLIGRVSDATSLRQAVLLVPAAVLIAGAVWSWAAVRGTQASPD